MSPNCGVREMGSSPGSSRPASLRAIAGRGQSPAVMMDLFEAFRAAVALLVSLDADLVEIVSLSLEVTGCIALVLACAIRTCLIGGALALVPLSGSGALPPWC